MTQADRYVIEVNQAIAGPREPRLKNVRPRKISDYSHVPRPWLDVAQRLSSPVRLGPPICDELLAFVQHVFTEEEASVARHLGLFRGRAAAAVARADRRDLTQTALLLERLAVEKYVIASGGPPEQRRYYLLPIMPGMFEMALIGCTPDSLSDWHCRFIELFETLYETGYILDYQRAGGAITPFIRVIPVGKAIEAHPMALPSDKLEIMLDRFETFGIGQCQCRMTMQALGHGCGKPLGNCTLMGEWAGRGIEEGTLRSVSKKNALEIKREAESHGLVTWMMNVESTRGQCSCSCCGCCCHALRAVTEFNAPSQIAPPHFLPRLEAAKCAYCGKCGKACPMRAIVVDPKQKTYLHLLERCVGCGLCVVACDRQKALTMEAVPDYRLPYRSWFSLIARAAPGMLRTSWSVWRQRG
jgi:Pyruvate/2-oxoacid:ferredoxin oxidoreductase delta subunit